MPLEQNPTSKEPNSIQDLLRTGDPARISVFFSKAVASKHDEYPETRLFPILRSVLMEVSPLKISNDVQKKALKAIADEDGGTKTAGKNAFLFINLGTIFTAIESCVEIRQYSDRDPKETERNYEEMLDSATLSVMENVVKIDQRYKICDQVSHFAKLGILSHLGEKLGISPDDELLLSFKSNPMQGVFLLREIEMVRGMDGLTRDEIQNYAQQLSDEVGASPFDIFNCLADGRSLLKDTSKIIEASGEDERVNSADMEKIDDARSKLGLPQAMKRVLKTLDDGTWQGRRQKRVAEEKYGIYGIKDGKIKTNIEVGKEFHLCGASIGGIEKKTFNRLRHPSRRKYFKGYI